MANCQEKEIIRFQEHLITIRKLYGWTIEELANKIGVTKQTISNLENKKTELSKVQYIAMRTVFEAEALSRPTEEAEFLLNIISKLIDTECDDDSEEIQTTINNAKLIASTIAGGACLSVAIVAIGMLSPAAPIAASLIAGVPSASGAIASGVASGAVAGGAAGWLVKIIKKENKKNGKNKK